MFGFSSFLLAIITIFTFVPSHIHAQTTSEWSMAGANPQRTSWLDADIGSVTNIVWYRPIEAYIDQKTQLVTGNRHVYLATAQGLLVFDAESGSLSWRYNTPLPLTHSPTVFGQTIYLTGYDRTVTALTDLGQSYQINWTYTTPAACSSNPIATATALYLTCRDGRVYSHNPQTGQLIWQYPPANQPPLAPILQSPAFYNQRLYFAAMDLYAYSINTTTGTLVWKSATKLPGERYQSFWPVIYNDYVIFTATHGYKPGALPGSLSVNNSDNEKRIERVSFFGESFSDTRYTGTQITSDGSQNWPSGTSLLDTQANNSNSLHTLNSYLTTYPYRGIVTALNLSSGTSSLLPFLSTGTNSGNRYPPIIHPTEQTLIALNSFSSTAGNIPRVKVMGWQPNHRYLKQYFAQTFAIDEPAALSGAGSDILISLCCDRIAGNLSRNRFFWNYPGTLDELLPRLADNDPNPYDAMWRLVDDGLERLQGYYAGSLDSLNGVFHNHGLQNPLIPYVFTNSQGQRISRLFVHRSNALIALGTSGSPIPLTPLTKTTPPPLTSTLTTTQIRARLETEIDRLVSLTETDPSHRFLNPGYYNSGIETSSFPRHYFENPGDTLLTLVNALEQIANPSLKSRLEAYLQAYYQTYFTSNLITNVGWQNLPREQMVYPAEVQASMTTIASSASSPYPQRNFYALYRYALKYPSEALAIYNRIKSRLITNPANLSVWTLEELHDREPWVINDALTGYSGFLQLQSLAYNHQIPASETSLRQTTQTNYQTLLNLRLTRFSQNHPWYGAFDNPTGIRANSAYRKYNLSRNFLYLSPEVANDLAPTLGPQIRQAITEYTYLNPYWFVAAVDNGYQESAMHPLYDTEALFHAKAWFEGASQAELSNYLDVPAFSYGDLFYLKNLTTALNASSAPPPIGYDGDNDLDFFDLLYVISRFGNPFTIFEFNTLLSDLYE